MHSLNASLLSCCRRSFNSLDLFWGKALWILDINRAVLSTDCGIFVQSSRVGFIRGELCSLPGTTGTLRAIVSQIQNIQHNESPPREQQCTLARRKKNTREYTRVRIACTTTRTGSRHVEDNCPLDRSKWRSKSIPYGVVKRAA